MGRTHTPSSQKTPIPSAPFPPCLRGYDKQVHNISPVIAEWDFKRLFGDPRDEAKFKLTPKGGSLHKDQRVNVQVSRGTNRTAPGSIVFTAQKNRKTNRGSRRGWLIR